MVTLVLTVLGAGLTAIVLRDIFHTLFAARGSGAFSSLVSRHVWRAIRRIASRNPGHLSMAGPLAILLIILLWTAGLVIGWACILWPHLPDQFLLSTGMVDHQNNDFLDAIYISLVTLATLGYGEITPEATWIRLLAPLEALIGFALFTASISWLMSIYPALARRRHLARHIALLDRVEQRTGLVPGDLSALRLGEDLQNLTSQVIAARDDFVQFPITYFFRTSDPQESLEAMLPSLVALGRSAAEDDDPDVRFHATLLLEALGDLAGHLAVTWLARDEDAPIDEVFREYASDHLRDGP